MYYDTKQQINERAEAWVKKYFEGKEGESGLEVFRYESVKTGETYLSYDDSAQWIQGFYQCLVDQGTKKLPVFTDIYNVTETEVMVIGNIVTHEIAGTILNINTEHTAYLFSFGEGDIVLLDQCRLGTTR